MKKLHLLATSSMTPAERKAGRFMRSPDGHPDGGTQTSGTNNATEQTDGNSSQTSNNDSSSNNTGDQFDPTAFWGGSAPGGESAPNGESVGGDGGESGAESVDIKQQLVQRLDGLSFGNVLDENIVSQMSEGNFEAFHKNLNEMGKQMVRESLAMQVQILKPFAEQLIKQVRNEQQQTLSTRDNEEALVKLFPAAKNPDVAKAIRPIYDQALKNNKGNREKAVADTKQMLRFMAGHSAEDLGIEVNTRGQGERGGPSPSLDWIDELTAR
jgi:hypothetical protein